MTASSEETGKKIIAKSSRNVSLSVLASRVLGLLRDLLSASVLGGGKFMSAWAVALMIPSLFRKILGEGALGTALVPILVHTAETEGEERAAEKFSTIFFWLCMVMGLITCLVALPAWWITRMDWVTNEVWRIALVLTPVVMPYSILICAVGIMTSCANSRRFYFLPTVTAILQNLVMIAALFFMLLCMKDQGKRLELFAFSVLLSGVIELLFMFFVLKKCDSKVRITWNRIRDSAAVKEVVKVAIPGMFGAAALQLSVIADQAVASYISEYAVSSLYFANRLVLLPIGVFAFAFGTVSIAEMSRTAEKNSGEFIHLLMFSLRNLLFITIPIAVFMKLFGPELLRLFFMRGAFTERALSEAIMALDGYVIGIPFFAAVKVTVAGFNARRDMKTPFYVSLFCVFLNIALNLVLMFPLKQGGVALATTISSFVNNFLLMVLLCRIFGTKEFDFRSFAVYLVKMTVVCMIAGTGAYLAGKYWFHLFGIKAPLTGGFAEETVLPAAVIAQKAFSPATALGTLAFGSAVFGVIFLPLALVLKIGEAQTFVKRFLHYGRKEMKG